MIPRIIELIDNRLAVTAEAYTISEIKAILDKYDMGADPYIAYVSLMSSPDSPFMNLPFEEKKEQAIYEVTQTVGNFDIDDPLLQPAIDRLKGFYETPMYLIVKELEEELHRVRMYLSTTPFDTDNMKDRISLMKDIDKIANSYGKVKEQANKELETKMRGDHEMGEYFKP